MSADDLIVDKGITTFVARETELTRLDDALQRVLQGKVEFVFVTGKPGAGKTSLLTAFMNNAEMSHSNVLPAYSKCGMGASVGDPFQPFDDLIRSLDTHTGQLSRRWHWRSRLRRMARVFGSKAKSAVGLVGSFIGIWYAFVEVIIQAVLFLVEHGMSTVDSSDESVPYQKRIGELKVFLHEWPILLCLDDFQHSDKQSCAFLADLHQRLAGLSAMIVVAFRPLEVNEDHPLFSVWTELGARLGASEIKLDELQLDECSQRKFVDEYLDTRYRPNALDDDFRHSVTQRTEGLPLFVVDLMNLCADKGWIRQEGKVWTQVLPVGQELPARPEDIIRKRWGSLTIDDQRRLSVAAIDGEAFTLRVLALALPEAEQQLREQVDYRLVNRQGWVARTAPRMVSSAPLARYQFLHTFYFEFASRRLRDSDWCEWNNRIGVAKKQTWGDRWPDIADELVTHFGAAKDWPELLPCLEQWLKYLRLLDARENMAEVLLRLGDTLRHLDRAQEALERFREAEQLAHENNLGAALDGALNGQAWVLFEDLHDYSVAEPRLREIASQKTKANQVASRRLFFALTVAQLAIDQPEAAHASLNQALREDDPNLNDRLDSNDLLDVRRWLLQVQDEKPGAMGISELLQRLQNEIGDFP